MKTRVLIAIITLPWLVLGNAARNAHAQIPAIERAALIALYTSTNGHQWARDDGWKTPPLHTDGFAMPGTEGDWWGVSLNGDETAVEWIELQENNLMGRLPVELANLSSLLVLDLNTNQLTGTIPSELGTLTNLEELWLFDNQLTGSIPDELGGLSNLLFLFLDDNQLTGAIPAALGNLSSLWELWLFDNQLTGSIPAELGSLTNLSFLYLDGNQLEGGIPAELGNLANLEELWLNNNHLSGGIPSTMGDLTYLSGLNLRSNALVAEMPDSLTKLAGLANADFSYNGLYTNDEDLRTFLNNKDPDWAATQTVPPEDVTATTLSHESIEVSWTPITYKGGSGGYRIYYAADSQPYELFGATANKYVSSLVVTGLDPDTLYHFKVQTRTNAHPFNENTIDSVDSETASVATNEALPDLSVTKTADADFVIPGGFLTYTLWVNNTGPGDAPDTTLTDNVPTAVENPEYSTNGGESWSSWEGTLGLGTITPAGSQQVLIRGTVALSATCDITNAASVSTSRDEPDYENNEDTQATGIWEICDGIDNDCDGNVDEGVQNTYYRDADADGFGDPNDSVLACSPPEGYVADNGDNCPDDYNPGQENLDGDQAGDACDGCPED